MISLQSFYSMIGGNYEEVCSRLPSEKLLMKVLKMFIADPSFDSLSKSFDQGSIKDSFNAVHTLKGVAANLGFSVLAHKSSALCEALRHAEAMPDRILFEDVAYAYQDVLKALSKLFSDEQI